MNPSYKILSFFIALIVLSYSCKETSPDAKMLSNMHDEVMVIHDAVMPEMKTTNSLRKQLKQQNAQSQDVSKKEMLGKAIQDLDQADEAMMVWMEGFKKPNFDEVDKAKAFYNTEMDKIQGVKTLFDNAISQATKILDL